MTFSLSTADGVATVVIAVCVASIGTFQWRTAQEKVRLDLYNLRFDVYVNAITFMQALMEWASVKSDVQRETRLNFTAAIYLVGDEDFLY